MTVSQRSPVAQTSLCMSVWLCERLYLLTVCVRACSELMTDVSAALMLTAEDEEDSLSEGTISCYHFAVPLQQSQDFQSKPQSWNDMDFKWIKQLQSYYIEQERKNVFTD